MDYRIFNVHVLSFGMRIRTGNSVYSLTLRTFVVCTEFDSGEISGRAQSLARNGHHHHIHLVTTLNFGFREGVYLLFATDSFSC